MFITTAVLTDVLALTTSMKRLTRVPELHLTTWLEVEDDDNKTWCKKKPKKVRTVHREKPVKRLI